MERLTALQILGANATNSMHAAFVAQTARSAESIKQDFEHNMARQTQWADDHCDYALDLQKRQDPNDGTVRKTSIQYTYTWVSNTGAIYNTSNANDDPNRTQPGSTWTLQTNIR